LTTTIRKTYSAGSTSIAVRTIVNGTQNTLNWLLSDHLGSASITTTADGTWFSELRYSAFGETRYSSGISATDYRYTGQLQQADINLYYYNARFYDPALGRFVQSDTIVPQPYSIQGYDRYAYVNNNPLRYTDPSGHFLYEGDWRDPCSFSHTTGYSSPAQETYFYSPASAYNNFGQRTSMRVSKRSSRDGDSGMGQLIDMGLGMTVMSMIQTSSRGYSNIITSTVNTDYNVYRRTESLINNQTSRDYIKSIVPNLLNSEKADSPQNKLPNNLSLEILSKGATILDRNGLTIAGRALQKHGDRFGSVFPQVKGSVQLKNYTGQLVVNEILNNPNSTFTTKPWVNNGVSINVIDVKDPTGRGVRFDAVTGKMITFLEP